MDNLLSMALNFWDMHNFVFSVVVVHTNLAFCLFLFKEAYSIK